MTLFPVDPDPDREGPGLFRECPAPPSEPYRVMPGGCVSVPDGTLLASRRADPAMLCRLLNEAFRLGWHARERAGPV